MKGERLAAESPSSVLAGSLATVFDPRMPLVVGGVACTFGAIAFGRRSRGAALENSRRESKPGYLTPPPLQVHL
jgi:hypothetical protein